MSKKMSAGAKRWIVIGVVALAVVLIAVAISVIFRDKEEYITTDYQSSTVDAVVCKGSNPLDVFFTTEDESKKPESATSTIKATYQNNELDKLSYTYDADYESSDLAKQAESTMHAKYNQYMAQKAGDLAPKFAADEEDVKISVFGEWDKLTTGVAKVFGLTEDDYTKLVSDTEPEALAKVFQAKGYTCELDD